MEWTEEMQETVAELTREYVVYGEGCDEACERCPYARQCSEQRGFWGCGAWEKGMGDDL